MFSFVYDKFSVHCSLRNFDILRRGYRYAWKVHLVDDFRIKNKHAQDFILISYCYRMQNLQWSDRITAPLEYLTHLSHDVLDNTSKSGGLHNENDVCTSTSASLRLPIRNLDRLLWSMYMHTSSRFCFLKNLHL